MIYLVLALIALVLLIVLGAFLMGGKDKDLKITKQAMKQARKSQADYTEIERLSSNEVRKRVKDKMVRK